MGFSMASKIRYACFLIFCFDKQCSSNSIILLVIQVGGQGCSCLGAAGSGGCGRPPIKEE